MRTGGVAEWNFLFEQFKTTKIDSDRQKYMAALSATEDPETLLNLLNMTIHREESGIRLQVKRFISGNVLLWPHFFSLEERLLLQQKYLLFNSNYIPQKYCLSLMLKQFFALIYMPRWRIFGTEIANQRFLS